MRQEGWNVAGEGDEVGKTDWMDHLTDTLRLRYDALTTGELALYQELMEQRGIEVPAWFTAIKAAVDAATPKPPGDLVVPVSERQLATAKELPTDEGDYLIRQCVACKMDMLVEWGDNVPAACWRCNELSQLQREMSNKIYEYEQAKYRAALHPVEALGRAVTGMLDGLAAVVLMFSFLQWVIIVIWLMFFGALILSGH